MNILVLGKPKYNIIMQTENYPVENSKNVVTEKLEITGGTSVYVACMLAKWGMKVFYAGAISGDEIGNKIKSEIESYGVDTKYLETNYESKSNINYVVINKANGSSTEVEHINNVFAQKFKYDFVPDYVITDGSDMGASMAIANNYPSTKIILLANKVSNEFYNLSKRSKYVCANINFAEALTKLKYEFNRPKSLVDFYQKIKDLNNAEYILMLRSRGVLYTKGRQVKMIPGIPVEKVLDDSNSGSAFFAAYAYGIINNYDMDEVAKIANIAGGLALTKVGSLKTIPEKEEVYQMAGIKEGVKSEPTVQANQANSPATSQNVVANTQTTVAKEVNPPANGQTTNNQTNVAANKQSVINNQTIQTPTATTAPVQNQVANNPVNNETSTKVEGTTNGTL